MSAVPGDRAKIKHEKEKCYILLNSIKQRQNKIVLYIATIQT